MELREGRLHLRAPALPVALINATVGLVVWRDGRRLAWVADTLRPDGLAAFWSAVGVSVELRSAEAETGLALTAIIENRGADALALEEIAPLVVQVPDGAVRVGESAADWSVYRNGYQSWSGTRAYRVDEADADPYGAILRESHVDVRHRAARTRGVFRSDLATAIVDRRSGSALGLGFLDGRDFVGAIAVEAPHGRFRRLAAVLDGDGIRLEPGARLELPALWIAAGDDGEAVLAAWAAAMGAGMQARVGRRPPVGWCSWYGYFDRVRETDVLANLAALTAMRDRLPCDYVMVDDGYQRAIGDWLEPNQKFPHGMRWLAARIRAAGFEPGLWLAPFLVRPEAPLFRARPDWFLRTPRGRYRRGCWNPVWGLWSAAYALDTTHPEVLHWLAELARTVVHQWGYRVLKLDFLFAAALPGVRHDASATRAQALRRGLDAIRAGAGEDAFLLGCGCPLGPAVGIVDAMRIGPDVAPAWTTRLSRWLLRGRHGVATAHAVRNTLTRAFMHRRLWINDPDCVIVRDRDTQLTLAEVRSLAAVVALSDGAFVLGDPLAALSAERRALIEEVSRLRGGSMRVPDLFARDPPSLVHCAYEDGDAWAAFNFAGRPGPVALPAPPALPSEPLHELWSGAEITPVDGTLEVAGIPAHGCAVLWARRALPDAPARG
jgi:alpha-galactosidase